MQIQVDERSKYPPIVELRNEERTLCLLPKELWKKLFRRAKRIEDEKELLAFLEEEENKAALHYCLKLLSMKSYPSFTLKEKLEKKGFQEKAINASLQYFIDYGAINDERWLEEQVLKYQRQGKGRLFVFYKFCQKVKESTLNTYLDKHFTSEEEAKSIERFLEKKFHKRRDLSSEEKSRTQKTLCSKGFSFSSIRSVMESWSSQ